LGQLVSAINKTTDIKVVGLCHEFMGFMDNIGKKIGISDWQKDVSVVISGINHFGWILEMSINDKDGLEILKDYSNNQLKYESEETDDEALVNKTFALSGDRIKIELFKIYGAMPYPGDRHICEFFPYFVSEKTNYGADFDVKLTSVDDRRTMWMDEFKKRISKWTNDDPNSVPVEPSHESLPPILVALFGGTPTTQPVTMPNISQVSNLPMGACVETMGYVCKDKITPVESGDLPSSLLSLVHKHCINQELSVEGAIEGNKRKVLQAMLGDPLNNSNDYRDIEKMLDEMLEANKNLLHQFFK
jgi:alpha-galactosidase